MSIKMRQSPSSVIARFPNRRCLVKIHIPLIGPIFRKVTISRSIRTLGTMLASGVPMLDAIKLSGEVSGNCHYEKTWQEVRDQVTTGKRICEVLAGNGLFPRDRRGRDGDKSYRPTFAIL